jgi:hypothetical protein
VYSENILSGVEEPSQAEEEQAEVWATELEGWWEERAKDNIKTTIARGERYKEMLNLRHELGERVSGIACCC